MRRFLVVGVALAHCALVWSLVQRVDERVRALVARGHGLVLGARDDPE